MHSYYKFFHVIYTSTHYQHFSILPIPERLYSGLHHNQLSLFSTIKHNNNDLIQNKYTDISLSNRIMLLTVLV